MKRLVFCWELGGNYGHIAGFKNLYHELLRQGFEVVFILRNLKFAELLSHDGRAAHCVQAPIPKIIPTQQVDYSYADILAHIGYLNPAVLIDYVGAWRKLILDLHADMVVVDHAPTALLAAHSLNLPAAALGTGFTLPPAGAELPLYRPQASAPLPRPNQQVLAVVNQTLEKFGAEPYKELGNLFNHARQFLCSFPELDHYGFRPETEYWGPLFSDDLGEHFNWPHAAEFKTFAYLTPKVSSLAQAIDGTSALPGHKLVHIPKISTSEIAQYSRPDLTISATPMNMKSILQEANLVINQGGMGVSSQCFLAGVRQVIVPTQMEQWMLSQRMVQLGLAYAVDPAQKEPPYAEIYAKAANCQQLANNISKAKAQYAGYLQEEQIEVLAEEITEPLL